MGFATMGNFFQLAALVLCFAAVGVYIYSYLSKNYKVIVFGNYIFAVTSISVIFASITLFTAFAISDFSILYVLKNSNNTLPMFYKISSFWSGQAGSLLLWILLLAVFGLIELYRIREKDSVYRLGVMLIMSGTILFFLILVCFLQNPFTPVSLSLGYYRDGAGLNPLLQNPGMVLHPPTLYIGYVGFTVIIAHSLGAILSRDFSNMWIKMTRPWSLIIWSFLTIGIVVGAWWAYAEVGWGGYWAWDPVENASLMPWLTATAFLHSAYVYEKTGKLKVFTFILLLITFELTILGTFITRSGFLKSVHSFVSNDIGYYFIIYIIISTIVYLLLFLLNPKMKELIAEDEKGFRFSSRTGLVFISNWIFIALTIAIAFGTFLPLFMGASYTSGQYNRTTIPFFALIFFLSGFGLLTGFKVANINKYLYRLIAAFAISLAAVTIMAFIGYTDFASLVLLFTIYFSAMAVIIKTLSSLKKGGISSLFKANRFYGAMIVHFGLVIISLGIVISSFYHYKGIFTVWAGDEIVYNNYTFKIGSYANTHGENYISEYLPIKIYKNNKLISMAYPEIRNYNTHPNDYFGEVSYLSQFHGDLYFVFQELHPSGKVTIVFTHQPYIWLIWAGCAIMVIGAFFGAFNFRKKEDSKEYKKSYLVEEK